MKSVKKQVALCTIGTMLEWYDFSLFASLAPIISELFFPQSNQFTAMMATFVVFASGFIMRPVGAIFFGHLGDRKGRKSTLLITILVMAIATAGIGIIPVTSTLSTVLLIIFRLVQGFASSGEYPGGIVLLAEQKNQLHKTFISSFGIFSAVMGIFFGTFVCTITTKIIGHNDMIQWGWRIPFLLGAPISIIGFFIRKSLLESVEFQQIKQEKKLNGYPLITLFKSYYKEFLAVFCFFIFSNVSFYVNFIYLSSYSLNRQQIDLTSLMYLNSATTLAYALAIPFFAFVADYIGKRTLMITGCILIIFSIYPLFMVILSGILAIQIIAQIFLSILIAMFVGPLSAMSAEYFPTEIRYTGVGMALNFSAALFGGTAPLVCAWIAKMTNNPLTPSYYVILSAGVALIAVIPAISHKTTYFEMANSV